MEFTHGRNRLRITEQEEQGQACKHAPFVPRSSSSSSPSASSAHFRRSEGSSVIGDNLFEKEHMFDKVVTPSDVGKLNRLVIPKQHAERYFPLDASANEKGLLLSFEDRTGKSWRFRYSYWNSSQSYVMTKGWSRFVKEKRLDAGDTVSFSRGVGDSGRHSLYIDWKRRPPYHDPARMPRIPLPGVSFARSRAIAKRVRLFGVNLVSPESQVHADGRRSQETSALPLLHLQHSSVESSSPSWSSTSKEQHSSLDLDL
ncbi:B3 [Musa troglodytarum]|uniref:B3 n=1 Tax=Musa troglodytarum TaxID=320322 RepID=A0A9E7H1M4_9LILI|nr:B3 [Musa troglodytarum]